MISEPTPDQIDALMCEVDDLYMDMQETYGVDNLRLADHLANALQEKLSTPYALEERLAGATVN